MTGLGVGSLQSWAADPARSPSEQHALLFQPAQPLLCPIAGCEPPRTNVARSEPSPPRLGDGKVSFFAKRVNRSSTPACFVPPAWERAYGGAQGTFPAASSQAWCGQNEHPSAGCKGHRVAGWNSSLFSVWIFFLSPCLLSSLFSPFSFPGLFSFECQTEQTVWRCREYIFTRTNLLAGWRVIVYMLHTSFKKKLDEKWERRQLWFILRTQIPQPNTPAYLEETQEIEALFPSCT